MTKAQISSKIRALKAERASLVNKKNECVKNIDALEEFSHNITGYINSFFESTNARKAKFRGLSSLIDSVKAINSYCSKLQGVLNGGEYQHVVSSIEQMQRDVSGKLNACYSEAGGYDRRINAIDQEIRRLQIQYNKMEDENV